MNNANILLPNLSPRQQEAVNSPINGPLLIVAGAGSGKTATLTARLRFLIQKGVSPSQIVAITFTNKAAGEMRRRLSDVLNSSSPFIGTFHAFGVRILKSEARRFGRLPSFSIYDRDDSKRVLTNLLKEQGVSDRRASAAILLSRLSCLKNQLLSADSLLNSSEPANRVLYNIFPLYEERLAANNAFDFDDLLVRPVELLSSDSALRARYERRFSHLLVDEYQDVNTAQFELVKLLSGPDQNITVVGDDNQAIYAFRGADFRNFLNFDRHFPETHVVVLDQNYRSTGHIISAASAVIAQNKIQRHKKLWTAGAAGLPVSIQEHEDEISEADWIASRVASAPRVDTAVLYRTNAQSRPLEQSLIESGLPYSIFGGLKFYERLEIRDLVAALRFAANPRDLISCERLTKNLYRPAARRLLASLPDATSLPPGELLNFILTTADYADLLTRRFVNADERLENVAELSAFISGFSDLTSALEKISLFESSDRRSGSADSLPLNLMTIHLAKGLEFDRVFIAGASEGLLPHERSFKTSADIEEERRLMYVAMTRARRELLISFYGIPSRFLSEIPASNAEFNVLRDLNNEERFISV